MDTIIAVTAALQAAIGALIAADGDLDGALLHLYKNDVTPTRSSIIGNFTEADYTGYAAGEITWGAVSISDDGHVESIGTSTAFRPTGTTVGNDIYGAYITTAGGALRYAWRFSSSAVLPIPMRATTDVIMDVARLRADPLGGVSVLVS